MGRGRREGCGGGPGGGGEGAGGGSHRPRRRLSAQVLVPACCQSAAPLIGASQVKIIWGGDENRCRDRRPQFVSDPPYTSSQAL